MKKFLIISLIILIGFTLVLATEFDDVFKKAKQGDLNAQYELGMMYKSGVGIPQNYKQAYIWFSLAAAKGHKNAAKKRNLTEKKLTPQQVGEAQDLAVYQQRKISEIEAKPQKVLKPIPNQKSVNGRFVSNIKAGTLFIITGEVDNPTASLISHVEVKGALITKGKIEAMTQTAFCGNSINENDLMNENITAKKKQLMIKNGLNNVNVNIRPGETVSFMIVFSDLPEGLQNFTVKVKDFDISN